MSYSLSRASGESVGTYTITASGNATQGNYTVTFQNGTLTISSARLYLFKSGEGTKYTYNPNQYVTVSSNSIHMTDGNFSFTDALTVHGYTKMKIDVLKSDSKSYFMIGADDWYTQITVDAAGRKTYEVNLQVLSVRGQAIFMANSGNSYGDIYNWWLE